MPAKPRGCEIPDGLRDRGKRLLKDGVADAEQARNGPFHSPVSVPRLVVKKLTD